MIGALRTIADFVLGRGEATITVPTFDAQLKPNQISKPPRSSRISTRRRTLRQTEPRYSWPTVVRFCVSKELTQVNQAF